MQIYPASFDEQAEQALRAIEVAFGVSVTLHDLRGTIRHPDGRVLLPRRHSHDHCCCRYGRYDRPGWDARCYRDCFTRSEKTAVETVGPFFKTCWKGLGELVVPLIHDRHHLMTIYAGAFRIPDAGAGGTEYPHDPLYLKMLESLPLPDDRRMAELGALLTIFGHGLLYCVGRNELQEDVSRGAAIRRFINAQAHLPVTIRDLARHLHLSPSRASHAVKEYTGTTFQDLLCQERMLRARNLLLYSQVSLEEIAANLGFKTGFYFNRVFRKFYGLPPGEFRRNNQGASSVL